MLKVVLTGGPRAGKTTAARHLRHLGFVVIPESAEEVIRSGKKPDDPLAFQWEIVKLQVRREKEYFEKYKDERVIFLDRGIPDSVGYTRFWGYEPPREFIELGRDRYDVVFFFERFPFDDEGFRVENGEEEAKRAEELVFQAYKDLGYELKILPLAEVNERLNMIFEELGL